MCPTGHADPVNIQAQLAVSRPVMHTVEAYMSGHASAAPGTGSCDCTVSHNLFTSVLQGGHHLMGLKYYSISDQQ